MLSHAIETKCGRQTAKSLLAIADCLPRFL
jgi:hypothetical protein